MRTRVLRSVVLFTSLVLVFVVPLEAVEIEQLKSDLMGQTMGGREKCWQFQSPSQIRELSIDETTEKDGRRIVTVTVKLQDDRVPGSWRARARVVYERVGEEWEIDAVGLEELVRLEED